MKRLSSVFLVFTYLFFSKTEVSAQVKYQSKDFINVLVSGTSTLHDWDMKATKASCVSFFSFDAQGHLSNLSGLAFSMDCKNLKSNHTGMDNNAYKALKVSDFPTIHFECASAQISSPTAIKCKGNLTIAGFTKEVEIDAHYKVNADNSITVTMSKKISMKDFNVEPPSFMMGTIKTGNDITIKCDVTLRK